MHRNSRCVCSVVPYTCFNGTCSPWSLSLELVPADRATPQEGYFGAEFSTLGQFLKEPFIMPENKVPTPVLEDIEGHDRMMEKFLFWACMSAVAMAQLPKFAVFWEQPINDCCSLCALCKRCPSWHCFREAVSLQVAITVFFNTKNTLYIPHGINDIMLIQMSFIK